MSPRLHDLNEDAVRQRVGNWTIGGTVARGLAGLVAIVLIGGLIFGVLGVGLGWIGEGTRQISPTNVKNQYAFAYDYNNSLQASARNYCAMRDAIAAETDPTVKSQRTSQMLAIAQNYTRIQGKYDAALQDAFRAKYVRPADVPDQAPTLQQEVALVC